MIKETIFKSLKIWGISFLGFGYLILLESPFSFPVPHPCFEGKTARTAERAENLRNSAQMYISDFRKLCYLIISKSYTRSEILKNYTKKIFYRVRKNSCFAAECLPSALFGQDVSAVWAKHTQTNKQTRSRQEIFISSNSTYECVFFLVLLENKV